MSEEHRTFSLGASKSDQGIISGEFETHGNHPGTVSTGMIGRHKKDPGGPSYGVYQFTSQTIDKKGVVHRGGTVNAFLKSEDGRQWAHEFQDANGRPLTPGTKEFSGKWKEIAQREPDEFAAAQHQYAGKHFYTPQADRIQRKVGIDLDKRSTTLQNVVWSTSIQHGPNTNLVAKAINREAARLHKTPAQLTDEQCIHAIYQARSASNPTTRRRYLAEERYAQNMLNEEYNGAAQNTLLDVPAPIRVSDAVEPTAPSDRNRQPASASDRNRQSATAPDRNRELADASDRNREPADASDRNREPADASDRNRDREGADLPNANEPSSSGTKPSPVVLGAVQPSAPHAEQPAAIEHKPAPAIPQVPPPPAAQHGIFYEPVQQFNKFVQSIPGGEEGLQKLSNWSDEKREETLRDWDLTRSPDQGVKIMANVISNEGIPLPEGAAGAIKGMASHIHEAEELGNEAQKFRYLTPKEVAEAAPGTNFKKLGAQGAHDFNEANPRAYGHQAQHWTKQLDAADLNIDPAVTNQNMSHLQSRVGGMPTLLLKPVGKEVGQTINYRIVGEEGYRKAEEAARKAGQPFEPWKQVLEHNEERGLYRTEHKFADNYLIPEMKKRLLSENPGMDPKLAQVQAGMLARWRMEGIPGQGAQEYGMQVVRPDEFRQWARDMQREEQAFMQNLEKKIEDARALQTHPDQAIRRIDHQAQEAIVKDIEEARARGYLDVSTPRNGAVFYDNGRTTLDLPDPANPGQRLVLRNGDRAAGFCSRPGNEHCRTIDMTPGGSWLEKQKLYQGVLEGHRADRAWAGLSSDFAKKASGEVHAFVRTDSAAHRVFHTVEQAELRANPHVNTIHYHHREAGRVFTNREVVRAEVPETRAAAATREGALHVASPPSPNAPSDWLAGLKQAAAHAAQSANASLDPFARHLKAVEDFSKRAADAVAGPTKAAIRGGLQGANDALNYLPMQEWAKGSRQEADKWERFAKDSGLEDTANAVQMVDSGVGLWKGGVGLVQALRNPETRAAIVNAVKNAPEALKNFGKPGLAAHEAGTAKIVGGANQMLQKINADQGLTNCHSCTIASYYRFYGKPVVAASDHLPVNTHELEAFFNSKYEKLPKGVGEVVKRLEAEGHGSSGVLRYQPKGSDVGHVVFTANVNGRVIFMDGQAGRVLSLEEVSGKTAYKFMPTPPPEGGKPMLGVPVVEGGTPRAAVTSTSPTPKAAVPRVADGGEGLPPTGKRPAAGPPGDGSGGGYHGERPFGMRPQDMDVFQDAARKHNRWILVRDTNPESLKYLGEPGYVPKGIDCKANTANVSNHPLAGLVVDPEIHPTAYRDPAAAKARWDEMQKLMPEGYAVNYDPHSPRYGCLQHNGNYVHGDYDVYDIIDPSRPQANLSLVTELHGQPHMQGPKLTDVGNYVNDRVGSPMVRHGGELQYRDHSNQRVMVFGPQGQRFEVEGEQQLRDLYNQRFGGRRGFDHEAGKEGGLPGKPGNVGQPGQIRSMSQDQPPNPNPGLPAGKDSAGGKPQPPDAGQKADRLTAQMVAHGLDPHLAASNVARGLDPLNGQKIQATAADAARIIDAAQFVVRKQQEEQDQQARLAKIKADQEAHEARMKEKFERDLRESERKEKEEKREEKKEQKADQKEHEETEKEEKQEREKEERRAKEDKQKEEKETKASPAQERQEREKKDEERKEAGRDAEKKDDKSANRDAAQQQRDGQAKDAKSGEVEDGKSAEKDGKSADRDAAQEKQDGHTKDTKSDDLKDGKDVEKKASKSADREAAQQQRDGQAKDAKSADVKDGKSAATDGKSGDREAAQQQREGQAKDAKSADAKDGKDVEKKDGTSADRDAAQQQRDGQTKDAKSADVKDGKDAEKKDGKSADRDVAQQQRDGQAKDAKSADVKDGKSAEKDGKSAEREAAQQQRDGQPKDTKSPDVEDGKSAEKDGKPTDPDAAQQQRDGQPKDPKTGDVKDGKSAEKDGKSADRDPAQQQRGGQAKDPKSPDVKDGKSAEKDGKSTDRDAAQQQRDGQAKDPKTGDVKDAKEAAGKGGPQPDAAGKETRPADSKQAPQEERTAKPSPQQDAPQRQQGQTPPEHGAKQSGRQQPQPGQAQPDARTSAQVQQGTPQQPQPGQTPQQPGARQSTPPQQGTPQQPQSGQTPQQPGTRQPTTPQQGTPQQPPPGQTPQQPAARQSAPPQQGAPQQPQPGQTPQQPGARQSAPPQQGTPQQPQPGQAPQQPGTRQATPQQATPQQPQPGQTPQQPGARQSSPPQPGTPQQPQPGQTPQQLGTRQSAPPQQGTPQQPQPGQTPQQPGARQSAPPQQGTPQQPQSGQTPQPPGARQSAPPQQGTPQQPQPGHTPQQPGARQSAPPQQGAPQQPQSGQTPQQPGTRQSATPQQGAPQQPQPGQTPQQPGPRQSAPPQQGASQQPQSGQTPQQPGTRQSAPPQQGPPQQPQPGQTPQQPGTRQSAPPQQGTPQQPQPGHTPQQPGARQSAPPHQGTPQQPQSGQTPQPPGARESTPPPQGAPQQPQSGQTPQQPRAHQSAPPKEGTPQQPQPGQTPQQPGTRPSASPQQGAPQQPQSRQTPQQPGARQSAPPQQGTPQQPQSGQTPQQPGARQSTPPPQPTPGTNRNAGPPPPASNNPQQRTGPPPTAAANGPSRTDGPPPASAGKTPSREAGPPPSNPKGPTNERSGPPPSTGGPSAGRSGPPPSGGTPPPPSAPPPPGRSKRLL